MVSDTVDSKARGRRARTPGEIPKRGWKDVLWRTKDQLRSDNLSLVSAGVAFYALLAVFPALAALVSLYGLLADPGEIAQQFENLAVIMPADARPILLDQVSALTTSSDATLGFSAAGGLLLALLSAMKGTKAVIMALNIAYNERESRGFFKLNLFAFFMTLLLVLFIMTMLVLVIAVPAIINLLNVNDNVAAALSLLRWPLMLALVLLALATLYQYAPSRSTARWKWVSWGSCLATFLWLLVSIGFSVYVENFGNYNKVYGSVGALIILLMWFYISAYAVLLGAELNAEMEHQTCIDTTTGEPQPMGERNAYVADTVGKAH